MGFLYFIKVIFIVFILYYLHLFDIYEAKIQIFCESESQLQEKIAFPVSILTFYPL